MFRCLNLKLQETGFTYLCSVLQYMIFNCTSFVLYFCDIIVDLNYLFPKWSQHFRDSYEGRHFCDVAIHQMETSLWNLLT